jgi:hypothetical protein
MIDRATVTAPEMIGLLVWWIVVLAAPIVLVRRWRGRRRATDRLRRQAGRPAAEHPVGRPGPPASPAATSETRASAASRLAVPRLPSQALEPLCRFVDFQRRLELAASELRARLSQLPSARWRIEPYPLTGERRNTFVTLGETGIFVISATYSPGHWDDVIAANRLASKIQALLPGYGGPVHPAICHPFTWTEPRIWHRADERGDWVGAWLVGGDSVVGWLMQFGPEHGLSAADLARFDELAKPNWLKGAIPTAPSWPKIHEAPSAGSHE